MKIIDDSWNETLGLATVTIAGKFGEASGDALCSIDDCAEGLQSRWIGYEIAHYRAMVQYLKLKKTAFYQRLISAKAGYCYLIDTEDYHQYAESEDICVGYGNALDNFERYLVNCYKNYKNVKRQYEKARDNEGDFIDRLMKAHSDSKRSYSKFKSQLEEREQNEDN